MRKPTKRDECEKCGSKLREESFDRVGALIITIVKCERGHIYTRFRLRDIG